MSRLTSGKRFFTWSKYCRRTASGSVSTMRTLVMSGRGRSARVRELGQHAPREEVRRVQRFLQGQVAEGQAREDVVDAALGRLPRNRLAHRLRRSGDRLPALHDSVEVLGVGDVLRQRRLAPAPEAREIGEPTPVCAPPPPPPPAVGLAHPPVPLPSPERNALWIAAELPPRLAVAGGDRPHGR